MLLLFLLLPLLLTGAEDPTHGDEFPPDNGVSPYVSHGGPPEPADASKSSSGGYAEGPKSSVGAKGDKGGIKMSGPVSKPTAGSYAEGPKPTKGGAKTQWPGAQTAADYSAPPKGGNGGGVPPVDPHGEPPAKPTEGSKPAKGGIKKQAGVSDSSIYSNVPAKHGGDGPKKNDAYAVAPEPQQRASRVQDQSPICGANAFFNTCPPPRNCEPSCQNYYPSCVWNRCYRPRCTCYSGYYRQSGAWNAPCIQWQQCWRWGGPRGVRPRPPRPGRFDGRTPWMWWLAAIVG